ncbi:MAG: hypothetical protein ACK5OA_14675 [Acidovorax sp.]
MRNKKAEENLVLRATALDKALSNQDQFAARATAHDGLHFFSKWCQRPVSGARCWFIQGVFPNEPQRNPVSLARRRTRSQARTGPFLSINGVMRVRLLRSVKT